MRNQRRDYDMSVDRGPVIWVNGWRLTELTYQTLVGRFGRVWADSYCLQMAQEDRHGTGKKHRTAVQ